MTERFAIDRDPALEALLYEPSGTYTLAAEAKWLRVTSVAHGIGNPAKPLSDTFYHQAIASGSIVPPITAARARYEDSRLGIIAIVVGICLVAAGITAFIWR